VENKKALTPNQEYGAGRDEDSSSHLLDSSEAQAEVTLQRWQEDPSEIDWKRIEDKIAADDCRRAE